MIGVTTKVGSARINWGASDPKVRGPVLPYPAKEEVRNAIGVFGGIQADYKGLMVAREFLSRYREPNYEGTDSAVKFPPRPQWDKIVSFDPWGHLAHKIFRGSGAHPSIAICSARLAFPEIQQLVAGGALRADGRILQAGGDFRVVKASIEYAWHLPTLAGRLKIPKVETLRTCLFEEGGRSYDDLVDRPDLELYLPRVSPMTIYIIGDPSRIGKRNTIITARTHDECNSSDGFHSKKCTCATYLILAFEEGIKTAQAGGVGVIVYNRWEGRGWGERVKFRVYEARDQQSGGDDPDNYWHLTEQVTGGAADARPQELMPDAFHWLGINVIHNLVSMSCEKHKALTEGGIEVVNRVGILADRIPDGAEVEIEAKLRKGYHPCQIAGGATEPTGVRPPGTDA